jgi:hypothetical protein
MENNNFEEGIRISNVSKNKNKLAFQQSWTENYGVIEFKEKVVCVFCSEFVFCRLYNIKRHFKKMHNDLALKSIEELKEYTHLYMLRNLKMKIQHC